jgi:hypothetical protein
LKTPWYKRKIVWIPAAIFVGLLIIGLLAPSDKKEEPVVATQTQTFTGKSAIDPPATTQVEKPAPPKPEDADTGRMSEGEYDLMRADIYEMNSEISAFRNQVAGECVALANAGELSATFDCVDEAYSGVQEDADSLMFTLDDLRGDVAKKCLKSVEIALDRVERIALVSGALVESIKTNDSGVINLAVENFTTASDQWNTARGNVFSLCAPV